MADTTRLPAPLVAHWQWQLQAACRGMDSSLFFHPANERNTDRDNRIAAAKQICRQCLAVNACLDHALRAREPYGIWGGLSENERAERLGVESLRYPAPVKRLSNPRGVSTIRLAGNESEGIRDNVYGGNAPLIAMLFRDCEALYLIHDLLDRLTPATQVTLLATCRAAVVWAPGRVAGQTGVMSPSSQVRSKYDCNGP